ncbi:NTF2 fold immunity protein [Bacteroides sp. An19]|uniref:NTF2 fold immunity protein n=1 Tax=Bacteroides sp. An19 TaxID=1965580 RepID=UPI000B38413B|nr:NTF2 fold immunity protein [Bacteroides sp. An19]OUP33133.1 hypothetical protein B5F25_07695 [Bacteroides sp. An19]
MDNTTKKMIEELVQNFISEMNEWEKYCNELEKNTQLAWDEATRMMKQKAASIISKYCTDKERKMSRPNALSWGVEGSYIYDPKEEKVIDTQETRKNRFTVITQNDNKYLQYTIIKKEDKYLIDNKKMKFIDEDKWHVDYL